MRSVSLRLVDLERKPLIPLGFEGENEYMTINFDCKTVFDKHPAAVPTLAVTPPQGDSYPAVVVRDGDIVSWTVCDSDLVYPGEGVLQLTFVDGTIIGKTYKARTKVLDSITPSGEAPTPIQNWLIQAAAALQALPTEVVSSVAALMGAMVGIGETLDPGENVTVSYDVENNALTIGVPRGADGHSPAITANKVGKVATFYVDGVAIATISDGTDGAGIDDNTVSTESTWSSKKIDDENSALKTEINSKPDILDSDAEDVDLDFTDSDGNVIMRLEGGHIKTKEFDSSEAASGDASVKTSDALNVDLDLTDKDGNVILRVKDGHIITKKFDSTIINSLLKSPELAGSFGQVLGLNNSLETEWQDAKTPLDLFIDNIDVDYRYDATTNANYTVIRVYKNTIHGEKQYPFVFAPNGAEAAGSRNKSTYEMNTEYGFVLALNAGIFNTNNGQPDGVLIMNGESFQSGASTTHSQCKPLWIDEDGDLHSSAYDTSSADLISQGCVSAVCGFMPIIVDYDPVPSSEWNNVDHYYQNAQRQIIGQFGNGDYAIVTCEGRDYQNSDGWTIAEAQTICQAIGLKFAYNLDGGGSTELMLGMKHVNTIYDGVYGRKVPTFIVFNGTTTPPANPTV